jgi:hypothetical protein
MTHGRHRSPRHRRPLVAATVAASALLLGSGAAFAVHQAGSVRADAEEPAGRPSPSPATAPSRTETAGTGAAGRVDLPQPSQPRWPPGSGVLLVGDSLAVGIADQLAALLPGRSLTVEAQEGRSTPTAAALLSDHAGATPGVWVVSLGTNDNPETFAADSASIVALAGPTRCLLWFDVWRPDTHDQIDAELTRLARQHPNVHVLAWHDLAETHPEWFSYGDVHPSTAGYAERSSMAANAVEQVCTESG